MARPDLFTHAVQLLRGGEAQLELSEQLSRLIETCAETGLFGQIVLTIKVKPNGRNGQYILTDSITVKSPKFQRADTILFEDADGNLTREDPRQQKMELRVPPVPELRKSTS